MSASGTLQTRRVALDWLQIDPANPRTHGEHNVASIRASLARFGQAEPLVVQAGTLRLIAGHGRLAAMRALGWSECDVVEIDIESTDAAALAIALNRTAELADWDDKALSQILASLRDDGALDGVGYDTEEIDDLLARAHADLDGMLDGTEDDVPAPPDEATTRAGDLWILGRHRLLCGDSASTGDVDRLLSGAPAHLVNMDPPYNVKVEPRSNNAIAAGLSSFSGTTHHQSFDLARDPAKAKRTTTLRPKDRPLQNDFVSDEEFARLLRAWFGNAARVLEPGRGFYIWGGYANCSNYPAALQENGLYFSQAIIWDKGWPVLTRKDYMGAHEWCFYGWKEGAAHVFFGPANATDLWAVRKVTPATMSHLTEKPVELAARAIAYSSRQGENVLDLFGGSGSTLIACDETGRVGHLMEIDTLYCDVIVERWQKCSGKAAVLEGTNKTHADLRGERIPA